LEMIIIREPMNSPHAVTTVPMLATHWGELPSAIQHAVAPAVECYIYQALSLNSKKKRNQPRPDEVSFDRA
jgi:hypothetical protein